MTRNDDSAIKKPSRDEIRLMVAAAQLSYEKEMTQQQVGKILGVSRPKVSRLLRQARQHGIVEIKIQNPLSRNSEVQSTLLETFGLLDAIVVPSMVDKQEVIVPKIATEAARYIMNNMPSQSVLGLGRGKTIYETAMALKTKKHTRPTVLPLSGGIGEYDADRPFNEIINRAAKALGGVAKYLYAPALLDDEKYRASVLEEPRSREVVSLWDKLDWVVLGIGTVHQAREPNPYYDSALDAFLKETKAHPVTEVNLQFILPDGRIPTTCEGRLVAATEKQIKKAKVRLAVAGGIYKLEAIHATLLSGLINVLITDENTALELLKLRK